MLRRTLFRTFAVITTGVVLASGLLATPTAAWAASEVISSANFDDGTTGSWQPSGGGPSTLTVVDDASGKVLRVAGRDADFVGIQSAAGIFEAGRTYTFSMRARLADGVAGSAGVRFVMKPSYTWIGNTTMTADAWTTVTGTYTVPTDADLTTLQVYIGTGDEPGTYDYLVDDVLVTAEATGEPSGPGPGFVPGGAVNPTTTPVAAAQGDGNVAALTFDDGPNPGETSTLLDYLAANDLPAVFCVIGQNIQQAGGAELLRRIVAEGHTLCNHSTNYEGMGSLSEAQASQRMQENLEIIRTALGDPNAVVPYFRAPNGDWGNTPAAAVALGMQPLAVVNTISDWEESDVDVLTANLRAAMKPGEVVLVHDGGGDRTASVQAVATVVDERLADGWSFTLPEGAPAPAGQVALSTDFESGLAGWGPRDSGSGAPIVAISTENPHGGTQSALVSGRTSQGSGIGSDVTGVLETGVTYELSAWVRFAPTQPVDAVWLSIAQTAGGSTSYQTLGQFTGLSNSAWVEVNQTFTMGEADEAYLYFETNYNGTNVSDFFIDDIQVSTPERAVIQDITPIRDTVDFPVGVAIDSRETVGAPAELLVRHFDQVTSENFMKPEAWYVGTTFTPNAEVATLMDFAIDNDLDVYGHTLVWHSQTPAWFFQDSAGQPLTTSTADQQVLRERMRTHIFAVAGHLSETYGEFGGGVNPITAFDVVNEVISDGSEYSDGMRRSEWYRILGEEFVDLAFQYADEAFNGEFAADVADRPVTLFINDYNTEQDGKQVRLKALVERLIERDVPIDGVGHQFHVSLATPVSALDAAIVAFQGLGLTQAVTELDVTTGTPVTEASLIEQGYYYRDAFRAFRQHADDLFSVTVWGLTDGRSWRASSGDPLVFTDGLQAKPAYYGIVDDELPTRLRSATVFQGDVPVTAAATDADEWRQLPLLGIDDAAGFQLRWSEDHLTAYVRVADTSRNASDGVTFETDDGELYFGRDGDGDIDGVVTETADGYAIVVHLPLAGASLGGQVALDVRITDGTDTVGWNTPGSLGTLSLVEALSVVDVVGAGIAPVIDGTIDAAWTDAVTVVTGKQVTGAAGATADVRTLWEGSTLYVLAEVADPVVDVSGSDPWIQDSIEVFVDAGNVKNGAYRYDDTQIRISATNVVSFGTGDEAFQANRVQSATTLTDGGYLVEVAIDLLESGGLGTFQGLDFQVNDAANGARTSIRNWADPTGAGYQSTARWGVGELVAPLGAQPEETDPLVELSAGQVVPGQSIAVELSGFTEGDEIDLVLGNGEADPAGFRLSRAAALVVPVTLASVTAGADGTVSATVTIPGTTALGDYRLSAVVGGVPLASAALSVVAADAGTGSAAGPDRLAATGMGVGGTILMALLFLAAGGVLLLRRRQAGRAG